MRTSRPFPISGASQPIVSKAMAARRFKPMSLLSPWMSADEHRCGAFLAHWIPSVLLVAVLVLVSTLPLVNWLQDASWHDQQRVGQVLALLLAVCGAALAIGPGDLRPTPLLDKAGRRLIALVVAAAIVSAVFARQSLWALTEVALGLGCLGLAWIVANLRRRHGTVADHVLLATLFFTCAGLMARFVAAYLAGLLGDERVLNAWLLVDGFSNPRFYGQFLTLALPLLVAPLLSRGHLRRYALIAGALTLLAWTAAITSGTRGTWLGLACAAVILACISPNGRRWALLQAAAAATGAVLFWLSLTVIPDVLGMSVAHHAVSRFSSSLSGREIIWSQAIEVALRHPLLGIGPMQLADLPNGVAAHPHQAWLQWAAEFGLPSVLLVTWLVVRGASRLFPELRMRTRSEKEQDILRLCLTGSVVGALTQSMVDGVLVMPYSQLWLTLLTGWLIGLQPPTAPYGVLRSASSSPPSRALFLGLAGFAAAVLVLCFVVVRDYPSLRQREEVFAMTLGGNFQPRFWAQGIIAGEAK